MTAFYILIRKFRHRAENMLNINYSGSNEEAGTEVPAIAANASESATEPITPDEPSENPQVELDVDSEIESSDNADIEESKNEKTSEPEEAEEAEKSEIESEKPEESAESAELIPSADDFYERNKRSMKKEVMDEVKGYLTLGRDAIAEKESLEQVIDEFGGQEILNGYKPVHEFIAELPPQAETDDWLSYYGKANNVWETLTSQNEVAAISLAMQGTLALVENAPNSHETILAAMFRSELGKTEAKGENSQADINDYNISSSRILELLRLDALGFVPKDLSDYADDFAVKPETVKKTETSAQPEQTVRTDKSETKTATQPTPQSEAYAEFEKDFESAFGERIKPALQKVDWTGNEDLSFVVANAAENLVRKSENFKLISDHLKAGNAYKNGDKLAVPIKLNKARVDNSATLQAEQLVKRLLKGFQATQAVLPKTEPNPIETESNNEPATKPVVTPRESGKFLSSTDVAKKLQELNGFGG